MVLQNESIDEELEHFEDVIEETDNEPSTVPKKQVDNVAIVQNGDDEKSDSGSSEGEDDLVASSEDDSDGDSEDADFLLEKDEPSLKKSKSASNNKSKSKSVTDEGQQSQVSAKKSLPPGGYDPRHREPSYCNADRLSWWELMVLASHAHPSVSTMARTLLSGANIVYNGNPLNDLNLTAFLDKFMEKKPKQSSWHGGSQIEPAKQMDINNHLIGKEILSLAEEDVPPEDLVFHKFYTNKMSSTKPKKKKKKSADDEEDAVFFDDDEVDGGDESDNEEIENLLDTVDQSMEPESYDYDDLDNVANEEDDDLIGDVDVDVDVDDIEIPSDMSEGDIDDAIDDDGGDDDNDLKVGDIDDASDVDVDVGVDVDDEDEVDKRKEKQKRKTGGSKSKASPFASYEEFEHLMEEDNHKRREKPAQKKHKSKKMKK